MFCCTLLNLLGVFLYYVKNSDAAGVIDFFNVRTIDGSTSLPFRSQGRFHLGGKLVVCLPDLLKKTIDSVFTILKAKHPL